MNNRKHEFAIYYETLSDNIQAVIIGNELVINDVSVYHRLNSVLRLSTNDEFILFDRVMQAQCAIVSVKAKQRVVVRVINYKKNKLLKPHMSIALPLLKRDSLEQAVYGLVELGVNDIFLLYTQKARSAWGKEQEKARLDRIMIAAAEQSKNFVLPTLHEPVMLEQFILQKMDKLSKKIYFDDQGDSLLAFIGYVNSERPESLILMVGPEGDLTMQEKELLRGAGFNFCSLTPTIIRAAFAICLGAGIFRSIITKNQ